MSVDKTSGIISSQVGKVVGNQNLAKPGDIKKAASGISREVQASKEGDIVEISAEARKLQETLSILKAEIKKIPDVREEKVKNVKARIEAGIYDRDKVTKEIARSIKNSGLL
ncbi:MAG: flagellar biosynthesis anti-sigma factor FlgM [Candidatus Scalindua sp.]